MDSWRLGMLAHSRLQSHRRLVDRTVGEIETALETPGEWYVSVSGGKDSTALLHLVRSVASAVTAVHGEEEIIAPGTVEYIESLTSWPGVTLIRTAAPSRHSEQHTSWINDPPLRPLPFDTFWFSTRETRQEWYRRHYVGGFVGTRREESHAREMSYRMHGSLYCAKSRGWWVSTPLHRWSLNDVWAYIHAHDVPYHPGYDTMTAVGIPPDRQRIGPPSDSRALQGNAMQWLRMTWPSYFEEVAQRFPWVREYA